MLLGCGGPATILLDVKATSDKLTSDKAYNAVTAVLVDKGFDIKFSNKDVGLITTEYKKWGELDGTPPFDFYLQIKIQIKNRPDGKLQITMTRSEEHTSELQSL